MTTGEIDTQAPIPALETPAPAPRRRHWVRALGWLGFWSLLLGLVGLNAWWAWEARPLADLKTISTWVQQRRLDEAEAALRAHLRQSPNNGEARLMLANVLANRDDMVGSARELHQVPYWWPQKLQALFLEGGANMAAGRARAAEAAWKACVTNDPAHPAYFPGTLQERARYFSGSVRELITLYNLEQRRDEARSLLWTAYDQANPAEHPSILIMMVWIEMLKSDPQEAEPKLRRYLETMPDDWEARRALARLVKDQGNLPEAHRLIEQCAKARPDDVAVARDRIAIDFARGDLDSVKAVLATLPRGADDDAAIWKARGRLLFLSQNWKGAAEAYRRAVRLDPSDEEAHYNLGVLEGRLRRPAEAEQETRRYKELKNAREEIRKAYDHYVDVAGQAERRGDRLAQARLRLASACEALGWSRLAEAWRKLVPGAA